MNPLTEAIIKRQYKIIDESQKFHDTLMKSLLNNDSLNTLCDNIFKTTNLSISIVNDDLYLTGCSSDLEWEKCLENIDRNNMLYESNIALNADDTPASGFVYSNFYLNCIDMKLFIYPIVQESIHYGYIIIAVNRLLERLSTISIVKIQQLSLIIALTVIKHNEINNATRRYNNLLLDQILHKDVTSESQKNKITQSLGKNLYNNYYIVIINDDITSSEDNAMLRNQHSNNLFISLKNNLLYFDDIIFFERGENYILFIPNIVPNLIKIVLEIYEQCKRIFKYNEIYIGISDMVELVDAQLGYKQALQAMMYSKTHDNVHYFYYSNLGILRYFMDKNGVLDDDFINTMHSKYIIPIINYDKKNKTQLMQTLKAYIINNCSKVTTEKQLFIHKNTLRARLSTIEQILECSINKSEDMFNIELALKIDYFYKNKNL